MKSKLFKRIASSVLAAALAAAPLVTLAETAAPAIGKAFAAMTRTEAEQPAKDIKVPEGYNEHDYLKLRAFLETEDEDGVKNGEKLSDNYDPDDPKTWWGNSSGGYLPCIWVTDSNEYHIQQIRFGNRNFIGSLDVSGCTALSYLVCSENQLTGLDVSGCTALEELRCTDNQIITLNASGCTALLVLACLRNQLTGLDVSGCTALWNLQCNENQLTDLDVSGCTALKNLKCEENQLTNLDVSSCTALDVLWCYNNKLTVLDIGSCSAFTNLDCSNNQLTSLDISNNAELSYLYCNDNRLTSLDISKNAKLSTLYCSNNQLTELDTSNNPWLTGIYCHGNRLTEFELSSLKRSVSADGNGWIGFSSLDEYGSEEFHLSAVPMSGCTFEGWYTPDGELLGTELHLYFWGSWDSVGNEFIAKFSGEPTLGDGDVDGDGEVTTGDALAAIRNAMGLQDMSDDQIAAADMDGDGEITTSDALMIIRIAMGL